MNLTCLGCALPADPDAGACPGCGGSDLYPWKTVPSHARFLCPATRDVVQVGSMGHQVDRPCRVVWQGGVDGAGRPVTEPSATDRLTIERSRGLVLGPGCVVSYGLKLLEVRPWPDRPGLLLQAVPGANPDGWVVNERLEYKACAACGKQTAVIPGSTLMETEWTARARSTYRGRGQSRKLTPNVVGPHPAGSVACRNCRKSRS